MDANAEVNFVVLGAGFSVAAGLPATNQVWNHARRQKLSTAEVMMKSYKRFAPNLYFLLQAEAQGLDFSLSATLRYVEKGLRNLKIITRSIDESDAEDLFTALQDAIYWPRAGRGIAAQSTPRPIHLLYRIVFEVLSARYEQMPLEGAQDPSWKRPPLPDEYVEFCKSLPAPTYIVTTNYDDILERALLASGRKWSYGVPVSYHPEVEAAGYGPDRGSFYRFGGSFEVGRGGLKWARLDWRPTGAHEEAEIIVCKIHGSMRWIKCYDCSRTYSVDFWAAFFTNFGDENASLQKDFMFKCWEEECVYMPALPALFPVREKLFLDHILKTQLETAQAAAERCRTLTVIGSALRDSDKDFVDLVRLAGTRGDTLIVVNPNKEAASRTEAVCGKTCERYDSLRALVHKDRRRWWWPFRWPA